MSDQAKEFVQRIFDENYTKFEKKLSTVLFKNRRYKIIEKKKTRNLLWHLFRNYMEGTRQRKSDFNPELTKNNVIVSYKRNDDGIYSSEIIECGERWFDQVKELTDEFSNLIQDDISKVSEEHENKQKGITQSQRDLVNKSIKYFSNLKDSSLNAAEQAYISKFKDEYTLFEEQNKDIKKGDKKNYEALSNETIHSISRYYNNVDKNEKVKSFGAKKKHIKNLLDNIEMMDYERTMDPTKSVSAVAIEERLLKIPKHNGVSLPDNVVIEILESWHKAHFKPFDLLKIFIHKDERTKKDNPEDDHTHTIISGLNRETKRYDLPDFTYQLMKKMADKQGFIIDCDKKWNKASKENQLLAGEAYQREFYEFSNQILEKHNISFRFGILAKNEANKLERDKIKADVDTPNKAKSARYGNYENLLREEFEKKFIELESDIEERFKEKLVQEKDNYNAKLKEEKEKINEQYTNHNKELINQNDTLTNENNALVGLNNTLIQENNTVKEDAIKYKGLSEKYERAFKDNKGMYEKLEENYNTKKDAYKTLQNQFKDTSSQLLTLEVDKKRLEKEKNEAVGQVTKLNQTISKLHHVINGLIDLVYDRSTDIAYVTSKEARDFISSYTEHFKSSLRRVFDDLGATQFLPKLDRLKLEEDKAEAERVKAENKAKEEEKRKHENALAQQEELKRKKEVKRAKKIVERLNMVFGAKAGSTIRLPDNTLVEIASKTNSTHVVFDYSKHTEAIIAYDEGENSLEDLLLLTSNDCDEESILKREESMKQSLKSKNKKSISQKLGLRLIPEWLKNKIK
ncbi:hypothetical protein SA750_003440 [Vibrio parahaemolyticus]|nr:hypothetical protein [Vibrio parahaemolyticus]